VHYLALFCSAAGVYGFTLFFPFGKSFRQADKFRGFAFRQRFTGPLPVSE